MRDFSEILRQGVYRLSQAHVLLESVTLLCLNHKAWHPRTGDEQTYCRIVFFWTKINWKHKWHSTFILEKNIFTCLYHTSVVKCSSVCPNTIILTMSKNALCLCFKWKSWHLFDIYMLVPVFIPESVMKITVHYIRNFLETMLSPISKEIHQFCCCRFICRLMNYIVLEWVFIDEIPTYLVAFTCSGLSFNCECQVRSKTFSLCLWYNSRFQMKGLGHLK